MPVPWNTPPRPRALKLDPNDPRLQPTAYVSHDRNHRFYEVVDLAGGMIVLEDCSTLHRASFAAVEIVAAFSLVRAAVSVPDSFAA